MRRRRRRADRRRRQWGPRGPRRQWGPRRRERWRRQRDRDGWHGGWGGPRRQCVGRGIPAVLQHELSLAAAAAACAGRPRRLPVDERRHGRRGVQRRLWSELQVGRGGCRHQRHRRRTRGSRGVGARAVRHRGERYLRHTARHHRHATPGIGGGPRAGAANRIQPERWRRRQRLEQADARRRGCGHAVPDVQSRSIPTRRSSC